MNNMDFEERAEKFLSSPYIDRQKVLFVDDDLYITKVLVEENKHDVNNDYRDDFLKVLKGLIIPGNGISSFIIIKELVDSYFDVRDDGVNVSLAPKAWIPRFTLPPGHPREDVIYIAHPGIPTVYVPTAMFHRFTFEHKFQEILSILMHLGAKSVEVRHISGWRRVFASHVSATVPKVDVEIGVTAGSKAKTKQEIIYKAELTGTEEPKIPDNLVWLPYEPMWQQIVEGRLRFGLMNFSLTLLYDDDFGINAGLKVKVEKAGLDLGGSFEKHESTCWAISGSF